jgi:LuxR family maltose regulon positive regulatory protein
LGKLDPVQILSTKLSTPPLRPRLVARSRLIEKLNQSLECGFILISAPAGYGKTTLLSAWLSGLKFTSSWLTLDDADNDPVRFLTYLSAALHQLAPSVGADFDIVSPTSPLPAVDVILTPLVNQLSQLNRPFWLALDDYHLIQNQVVHQVLGFLLDHRPPPLHVIVATRADPPLPLSKMRARCEMLELRQAELRFIDQEAADFLNHTMGLQASVENVAQLVTRTEGWVAGLQMVALSMQNTDDNSTFISTLSGSQHYIFDYLMEEILARQSPDVRRFMLNTSILDQFTAPLCDAVMGMDEGGKQAEGTSSSSSIIEYLERANLFISSLDQERRWHRYHGLFTDLLRGYLRQKDADTVPILHARAGAWFEENGMIAEAISHALAAGEWNRVLRLINANVFALLEQNELSSVAKQLDSVTDEKSRARPWLAIGRAWLAAYLGQLNSVEGYLNSVEATLLGFDVEMDRRILLGQVAAIRAYAAWIAGNRDIAERAAREALENLPATDYSMRCHCATLLGLSLDDCNARAEALEQALVYASEIGASHVAFFAHGCWAYLLFLQGRLREAHAACLAAMRLARSSNTPQPLPTLSHIYSTLSLVLCEWNDLENGLRYAREAVALARRWGQADAMHFAYTGLGGALFASGEVEEAFDVLRQAWQVAHRTSAWFEEITIGQEVAWYLAQGNPEAAVQRLRLARVDAEESAGISLSPMLAFSLAQLHLAQKQFAKALEGIASSLRDLEERGVVYYLVSALLWQALAYQGSGQKTQALASLAKALALSAPQGYVRTFLSAGDALIPLLLQARAAGIVPDYVDKLLASGARPGKSPSAGAGIGTGPVESLSLREMDVLRLLEQGCSDKQIAEALVIARGTVHKHLKNIYAKLDAHSRTAAIAHARELGLL